MEVFILLILTFLQLSSSLTASDYTSLVYKGCGQQTYLDSTTHAYTQTLSSLFDSLISQSSNTKFFKTSTNDNQQQPSFSALYQCRGDLNTESCHNCVSKLPQTLNSLCGKTTSGRVQLLGCYILYEPFNSPEVSGNEMVFKTCSPMQAVGNGFEERRDTAFAALERGIVSGYGFYTSSYQSVYVLGQCEGDLAIGDCSECVRIAIQNAQVECGNSVSGQIYLHKCFISFNYSPNGIFRRSSSEETRQNSGKAAAIFVGCVVGVGLCIVFLKFIKSLMEKHDDC